MPKVVLGAGLESVRGKLGGTVFRKNRSGHVIGHTVNPAQRQTAGEARIRGNINRVAGDWAGLSDLRKDAWNRYASLKGGPLTGFNMYLRHNTRLLNANHASLTQINMPPATPSTPDFVRGLDSNPANGGYTITWTTPDSAWQWVQVQYSIQVAFSMKGKERWTLLPAVASNLKTTTHTLTLPTGYSISYRARSIDNRGRVSPWSVEGIAGAEPPPPPPSELISLKEHRQIVWGGTFNAVFSGGATLTAINDGMQANGWMYFFFNIDSSYGHQKKVKIKWRHLGGGSEIFTNLYVYDASYDRSSGVDFPPDNPILLKGNGLLQALVHFPDSMSLRTETFVLDLSGASEDNCCVMVQAGSNAHVGSFPEPEIYEWYLLASDDSVLQTFVWATIDMELTGTQWDYGITEA